MGDFSEEYVCEFCEDPICDECGKTARRILGNVVCTYCADEYDAQKEEDDDAD